jgi:hypothetical protein
MDTPARGGKRALAMMRQERLTRGRLGPRVSTDALLRPCKGRDRAWGPRHGCRTSHIARPSVEVPVNATSATSMPPEAGASKSHHRAILRVPPRPPGATPPRPATKRGAIHGHAKITSVALALGRVGGRDGERERARGNGLGRAERGRGAARCAASSGRDEGRPRSLPRRGGPPSPRASCGPTGPFRPPLPAGHRGDHAQPCDFTAPAAHLLRPAFDSW